MSNAHPSYRTSCQHDIWLCIAHWLCGRCMIQFCSLSCMNILPEHHWPWCTVCAHSSKTLAGQCGWPLAPNHAHSVVCNHQGAVYWWPWAARYNTWLLIKLTPKSVVFSFSFLFSTDDHADYKSRVHLLSDLRWNLQAHMLANLKPVDLGWLIVLVCHAINVGFQVGYCFTAPPSMTSADRIVMALQQCLRCCCCLRWENTSTWTTNHRWMTLQRQMRSCHACSFSFGCLFAHCCTLGESMVFKDNFHFT